MKDVQEIRTKRGNVYGLFVEDARISQKLKAVMKEEAETGWRALSPDQTEALEMIVHKIARILNGEMNYADSWVTIARYAKLVADRLDEDALAAEMYR